MSDLEKLKALLTEFGVPFTEDENEITVTRDRRNESEKVGGYSHFFTAFVFNEDSSFNHMGAWE